MKLFRSEFEALNALKMAQANERKGRTYTIQSLEGGWFTVKASAPLKVSQCALTGRLLINRKPMGELIQGLFRQCTDHLSAFRLSDQTRFLGLMTEHGKEREANLILQYATQP